MAGRTGGGRRPGDGRRVIVYFGGTAYDGVAGTDRQLAERLAAMAPVLYVDPPVSLLTPLLRPHLAASLKGPPLRREGRDLWRLIPRVPPGAYRPGTRRAATALTRRAAREAAAKLARRVTAVVIARYDDLLGAVPGARTVFYATDDLVAGADLVRLPRRRLEEARDRLLARADAVVAVSPPLRDDFRRRGRDAALIPTGCAPSAYDGIRSAPWPSDVPRLDRPAAGFVGHINARIDLALLEGVAAAGHPLVLVGPHDPAYEPARFAALAARPDVHWTGRKGFAELPSYMRTIKVGLTPYADGAFNRASFPIKTLDYLAAGRAAVAADLPATRWLRAGPEGAELIRSEGTAAGFVRAVGAELAAENAPSLVERRRRFAARHDWDHRARALAEVLGIRPPAADREEVPAP
ncbi:glycosyltransferase [Spirillospora sp. NPDC029432]|uniref:glycosyltransferase n=1 Tax=Spirillospora sp. NPDC029432 TaxID=3154599 RepID=UPI0034566408